MGLFGIWKEIVLDDIKQLIFFSEMKNPHAGATSSQIMTRNLLYGFRQVAQKLVFVPILTNMQDHDEVERYYEELCDTMIFFRSVTKHHGTRLKSHTSMLKETFLRPGISIDALEPYLTDSTVLVSHSPSIDSALLCIAIKRKHPEIRYIQFWSDPMVLSLITPEQYTIKRLGFFLIGRQLHKYADRIVYGTRSLCDAELIIFPEIRSKTFSVEASYCFDNEDIKSESDNTVFGYFGNYYSNIRNIRPLYDAFDGNSDAEIVICGSGDIVLEEKDNTRIMARVPQSEVAELEAKVDVVVCILNRVGVQIPGKVFYQTNTQKHILVILDGPNQDRIREELEKSGRFIFCENDVENIRKSISDITAGKYDAHYSAECYAPERVCREILGDLT